VRLFGSSGDQSQLWTVTWKFDRQPFRGTRLGPLVQRPFDNTVLKRLVGLDDDAATDSKRIQRPRQRGTQRFQLLVDFDTQCLEGTFGGMTAGPSTPRGNDVVQQCNQSSAVGE